MHAATPGGAVKFPWSPIWSRLWQALAIAAGIATTVLFMAFLALEFVGWFYCEANHVPGCSTLSYWSVANFGAFAMIRATLIAAAIVNAFLAGLCYHWWDVARRQRTKRPIGNPDEMQDVRQRD
jgi:hypothetical protein